MTLVPNPALLQSGAAGSLTRIAIIGRGFTGLMTAIALLKTFQHPFHLVMFDPFPKIDGGESIGRPASPLLNSRVRDLSVNPLVRDDFRRWLEERDNWRGLDRPGSGNVDHAFVPGEVLSGYAYQRFSEALRGRTDVLVQVRAESVTTIGRDATGGLSLLSGDGERMHFDAIFLATGYGLREGSESHSGLTAAKECRSSAAAFTQSIVPRVCSPPEKPPM